MRLALFLRPSISIALWLFLGLVLGLALLGAFGTIATFATGAIAAIAMFKDRPHEEPAKAEPSPAAATVDDKATSSASSGKHLSSEAWPNHLSNPEQSKAA